MPEKLIPSPPWTLLPPFRHGHLEGKILFIQHSHTVLGNPNSVLSSSFSYDPSTPSLCAHQTSPDSTELVQNCGMQHGLIEVVLTGRSTQPNTPEELCISLSMPDQRKITMVLDSHREDNQCLTFTKNKVVGYPCSQAIVAKMTRQV